MKKKNLSFFLVSLLGLMTINTACNDNDEDTSPDSAILGSWELKSTVYKVTANDASAGRIVEENLTEIGPVFRDTIQFFPNGYYNQGKMILLPCPPTPENGIITLFTFNTYKDMVEVSPTPISSISGFKARYTAKEHNLELHAEGDMEYYKSGRYLYSIGLDSTKVTITDIKVTGYFERVPLLYTEE